MKESRTTLKEKKAKAIGRATQRPRRETFARVRAQEKARAVLNPDAKVSRRFDYDLDYAHLDLRARPELYRVGMGEQGVLLVEPYKSEILPLWKFRTPAEAQASVESLEKLFRVYHHAQDFIGMDMVRKYLQMGFTRSRRYANHASGRKYSAKGEVLPRSPDERKAESAKLFRAAWDLAEADPLYAELKRKWRAERG